MTETERPNYVCFDYLKGKCNRADCKFAHVEKTPREGALPKGWGPADKLVPPRKGQKAVPVVSGRPLDGFKFVITGCLESLEREEATALIEAAGGRVTKKVSKATDYVLRGIDVNLKPIVGGKVKEAEQQRKPILDEDGLFAMLAGLPPMGAVVAASAAPTEASPSTKRAATFAAAGGPDKLRRLMNQWAQSMPPIEVDYRTWVDGEFRKYRLVRSPRGRRGE